MRGGVFQVRVGFAASVCFLGAAGVVVGGVPVNDDCANAIPIFDGLTAFDTISSTTDGPAHAVLQSMGSWSASATRGFS